MQTVAIFSRYVQCENNDRLGLMHTTDDRKSVWYENQRLCWFHQSARSLTREDEEEEEYDDGNSKITYKSNFSCKEMKVRMYGPIRHS